MPNHLNPQLCFLQHSTFHYIHHCAAVLGPINQSADEKLFGDAAREEARESNGASTEGSTSKLTQLESQYQNWTGEESMQDAVLRMLVDKYKPLRSGPIRIRDQKLKDSPLQAWRQFLLLHAHGKKSQTRRCFLASMAIDLGIRPSKHLLMRPHR